METKQLKKYAPEARRDFIAAVKNKAAVYGLLPKEILPMKEEGDVVIIGDRPFPRSVAKQRKELEARIRKEGFQQFIEAVAYTWFNRFVAIRYMELHGYLDHGYRVLSHPEGKATPEILENAERVELPGLKRDDVVDLKLDGGKDEQLYQMLLLAQCNALHKAMPFLFESIKDGTELLLPDNLLHTDSLVRTLVNDIPEEQWENVEIIGWLYQFYISERKDEVIGKVVKSEDIPAATQLFTPNWIVKYLVQNSLGRQWVATYPDTPLKQQMEFYIEPAEQAPEVQQQLDEITPDSLNPEEITLLDPACGSGHILVEAYDLFKAIYTERGYRPRDIPKCILTKNLYGLEIDDRAAQLSAFALIMKARADDRGIFERDVQPHVLSIQESKGFNAKEITDALNEPILLDERPHSGVLFEEIADEKSPLFSRKNLSKEGNVSQADIAHLIDLFENGKTFGSLIRISAPLSQRLRSMAERVDEVIAHGGMFEQALAKSVKPIIHQALVLCATYDCIAMNPPYMGSGAMNATLSTFAKNNFKSSRYDLMTCFMERGIEQVANNSFLAMINQHSWMFLSRFEGFRGEVLRRNSLPVVAHLGARAFPEISGEVVQSVAFSLRKASVRESCRFARLTQFKSSPEKAERVRQSDLQFDRTLDSFLLIPGAILAYWASDLTLDHLQNDNRLGSFAEARRGLQTGDAPRFIRYWHEVSLGDTHIELAPRDQCIQSDSTWFLFNNGGEYQKWYGNVDYVVNWRSNGADIKSTGKAIIPSEERYFSDALTWSRLSGGRTAFRYVPEGVVPGDTGPGIFTSSNKMALLGYLNSTVARHFLDILVPSMTFLTGDIENLPVPDKIGTVDTTAAERCLELTHEDWDEHETSWGFQSHPLFHQPSCPDLQSSLQAWNDRRSKRFNDLRSNETDNNRKFIQLFGLQSELDESVPIEEVTIGQPDREADIQGLVSYALGCMMGRYSLDKPGLIYAHSGNTGFDASKYKTFRADDDGIVPITDMPWFADDAANRFEQFVKTVWPEEHLEENLKFVAESLDQKKGETTRECIRRYLATGFYKHHLTMYKKRPIYWLFSSGKQRAFQCLVYLHRYNAGTLSRMRTEYVVKLQGKINARIDQLEDDIPVASSTSQRKQLEKERDTLVKQREELQDFDEKLREFADQRIELDLDDGVKVNYGKFGDLLAEVKAITGEKPEVEVTT